MNEIMSIKDFYKIQKEVENRSWRHQPTKPVLPCWGNEFIAIRGRIERIDKEVEEHGFEIESYEHVKKSIKKMREGAKIGAILGIFRGQYGLTGGHMLNRHRVKQLLSMYKLIMRFIEVG